MVTQTEPALSREQLAYREVGHTNVSPGVARALVVAFLLLVCAVPAFELIRVAQGDSAARSPWLRLGAIADEAAAADRLLAANRAVLAGLHEFEDALEDRSRLGRLLRPRAQLLLSGLLGVGNEQAYVGRDGWLFYRVDVEYVTTRGFLREDVQTRRVKGAREWTDPPNPDPRPAILQLKRQLDQRGIALIVVPVPVKPMVHPEMLARSADAPARNADHAAFVADLRRGGVNVFDATRVLDEARATGATQYLATDTHWRPEAMEHVVERLAAEIQRLGALPAVPDPGYRAETMDLQRLGDTFLMLDLPSEQTLYRPEPVTIRRIVLPDGTPWQSSRDADVLVLGDSFSNMFSLETMGWGTSAGLVEQLSYALRRPVDRMVQNDAGSYATREMFHRAEEDRIAPKKLVIYQFATRELAFGDWKVY